MQTRLNSIVEVICGTGVGFVVSLFAQSWYLDKSGVEISTLQNSGLVAFMTVISVVRSYLVRRLFNSNLHKYLRRAYDGYRSKIRSRTFGG